MSKPTLGRGLSDLLGARRDAGQELATPPRVDGGLRILIDGAAREEDPAPLAPAPVAKAAAATETKTLRADEAAAIRILVVAALTGADVALLGWAVWFAFTHEHALGFLSASLCALSVLTAAGCGCAAVLMMQGED